MNYKEFNKKLRDKFQLGQEVKQLMYEKIEDKFYKKRINKKYKSKIEEYTKFKMLVVNSYDPFTGLVKMDLLNSFIQQAVIK